MKQRYGQSGIIGGTFLVLIILTSYSLYLTYNRAQRNYMEAQSDIREKDLEMQQETLSFQYDYKWLNGHYNRSEQYLYLVNTGSLTSHIIHIVDIGNEILNHTVDIYLLSGSSFLIEGNLSKSFLFKISLGFNLTVLNF